MTMVSKKNFYQVHRKLIAKAIEELHFDEVLKIERNGDSFTLRLRDEISYFFKGNIGPWAHVQVDAATLKKQKGKTEVEEFSANSFFVEIQEICEMSDQTLAQYLEEANQTLFSDLHLFEQRHKIDFSTFNYQVADQRLPGHTKIIMNKGRIGWSKKDIEKYAPEFHPKFKLVWLAIKPTVLDIGLASSLLPRDLVPMSITNKMTNDYLSKGYIIVPVHPWQWEHYLHNQFLELIANKDIVYIGAIGDDYTPQSSLRTLSNLESKNHFDIKLSLSILNTSCVRGIPSKYIKDGHNVSTFLNRLINKDTYLATKVDVLQEVAAVRVRNIYFDKLDESSYRYREFFGCVWRERVEAKLNSSELAIPCAALLIENNEQSYFEYILQRSGLDVEQWIAEYLKVVVLPLYYLQKEHGIGLVAHGQNIILVLEKFRPKRLIIKDFHGDLRLATTSRHLHQEDLKVIDRLPPEYLIHDLLTGHFVTVMRYFSRLIQDKGLLEEKTFYSIAWRVINEFHNNQAYSQMSSSLLKRWFEKILVNKVRFIDGYSETSKRLEPCLGSLILNPLRSYHANESQ